MSTLNIADGVLTNEHAACSYRQPVFIFNGIAHGQSDHVDLGEECLDFLRFQPAANHVELHYRLSLGGHDPRKYTNDEYALISKFCGLK